MTFEQITAQTPPEFRKTGGKALLGALHRLASVTSRIWRPPADGLAMNAWHPATIAEVQRLVEKQLCNCDGEQVTAFEQHTLKPFKAAITRQGRRETVIVVARKGDEGIYYEDIVEGFNVSPISPDCVILEHWCNQDDLGSALNTWIEGRGPGNQQSPATYRQLSVLQERQEAMILERLWAEEALSKATY